jgi:hypothetical protein
MSLSRYFHVLHGGRVQVLIEGTLLARGRRTMASALRDCGYSDDPHFSSYHQVKNRANWSLKELNQRLLSLLVRCFLEAGGRIAVVVVETKGGRPRVKGKRLPGIWILRYQHLMLR